MKIMNRKYGQECKPASSCLPMIESRDIGQKLKNGDEWLSECFCF